jgi:polyphosphate glucokinase
MRVLVVDIGGTNVKVLATGERDTRKAPSGRAMTPAEAACGRPVRIVNDALRQALGSHQRRLLLLLGLGTGLGAALVATPGVAKRRAKSTPRSAV